MSFTSDTRQRYCRPLEVFASFGRSRRAWKPCRFAGRPELRGGSSVSELVSDDPLGVTSQRGPHSKHVEAAGDCGRYRRGSLQSAIDYDVVAPGPLVRCLMHAALCHKVALRSAALGLPPINELRKMLPGTNEKLIPLPARDAGRSKRSSANDLGDGLRPSKERSRSEELPSRKPLSWIETENRRKAVAKFDRWLQQHLQVDVTFLSSVPSLAGTLLASYGREFWRKNSNLGEFKATVLAVQDMFRYLRPQPTSAWDQVRVWEELEPSMFTTPCPKGVCKAVVVIARSWGWDMFVDMSLTASSGATEG